MALWPPSVRRQRGADAAVTTRLMAPAIIGNRLAPRRGFLPRTWSRRVGHGAHRPVGGVVAQQAPAGKHARCDYADCDNVIERHGAHLLAAEALSSSGACSGKLSERGRGAGQGTPRPTASHGYPSAPTPNVVGRRPESRCPCARRGGLSPRALRAFGGSPPATCLEPHPRICVGVSESAHHVNLVDRLDRWTPSPLEGVREPRVPRD